MPKLTVQLVTWNSELYIPLLFASLRAQTYTDWELLVWDNHSSDDTVVRVEAAAQHLLVPVNIFRHGDDSGFAFGHNQLFRKSASEYVLLLNPDMYLNPDCFLAMVTSLDVHGETAAVSPRLMRWNFADMRHDDPTSGFTDQIDTLGLRVFRNRRVVDEAAGQLWSAASSRYLGQHEICVFGLSGALPMYRRTALEQVLFADGTMFDEFYVGYKEDVDLAFRLQAHNFASRVLLDAVAYHDRTGVGPKALGDLAAAKNKIEKQNSYVKYHSYKNHLATLYKNEYWQNFILDFPWIVWYELKKFGWLLLYDRAVLAGLRELWQGRKQIRQKRLNIVSKRQVPWQRLRRWWL